MDKKTINAYNQQALEYDTETTDFWQRFPSTIIDTFAREVGSGSILDVGSGPGRDGLILKGKGFDVVCLDAAEEMLKLSRARGLESVEGDMLALPFSDESFEGAWSYTTILHVPKAEVPKAFSEIARVLKPRGVFGLGLIEGDTEFYRDSSRSVSLPRWFSFYQKEEIEDLLEKHGFSIVYFEQFKPGSKNYLNFISRKN